eukprot:symbB.v1.2.020257.t1/scaffold1695.1/size105566/11
MVSHNPSMVSLRVRAWGPGISRKLLNHLVSKHMVSNRPLGNRLMGNKPMGNKPMGNRPMVNRLMDNRLMGSKPMDSQLMRSKCHKHNISNPMVKPLKPFLRQCSRVPRSNLRP